MTSGRTFQFAIVTLTILVVMATTVRLSRIEIARSLERLEGLFIAETLLSYKPTADEVQTDFYENMFVFSEYGRALIVEPVFRENLEQGWLEAVAQVISDEKEPFRGRFDLESGDSIHLTIGQPSDQILKQIEQYRELYPECQDRIRAPTASPNRNVYFLQVDVRHLDNVVWNHLFVVTNAAIQLKFNGNSPNLCIDVGPTRIIFNPTDNELSIHKSFQVAEVSDELATMARRLNIWEADHSQIYTSMRAVYRGEVIGLPVLNFSVKGSYVFWMLFLLATSIAAVGSYSGRLLMKQKSDAQSDPILVHGAHALTDAEGWFVRPVALLETIGFVSFSNIGCAAPLLIVALLTLDVRAEPTWISVSALILAAVVGAVFSASMLISYWRNVLRHS